MADDDWLTEEVVAEVIDKPYRVIKPGTRAGSLQRRKEDAGLAQERLSSIENELFEKSMEIVNGALSFTELDAADPMKIPQEWLDELGDEGARKRHFAATQALRNGKEAPVGLKMAENMASNIIRARATEKAAPMSLNIEKALIPFVQIQQYPELIVQAEGAEDEDDDY